MQSLKRQMLIFQTVTNQNICPEVDDFSFSYILNTEVIGGSRGGARRMPPPKGPDSFVLTYKIF